MTHHHHGGRGFRGGYPGYPGYGYPIIIEENYVDPEDLIVGEEKAIALSLGPPPAVAAVPAPLSTTPDAALAAKATPPIATPNAPIAAPATPKKSMVPTGGALAGGAAGFLVGGPIGAAIGAAIGYFGGKAVSKDAPVASTVVAPPPVTKAPTVAGDFGCSHTAGWSPHGDERMR
jgi:hypothetical protein